MQDRIIAGQHWEIPVDPLSSKLDLCSIETQKFLARLPGLCPSISEYTKLDELTYNSRLHLADYLEETLGQAPTIETQRLCGIFTPVFHPRLEKYDPTYDIQELGIPAQIETYQDWAHTLDPEALEGPDLFRKTRIDKSDFLLSLEKGSKCSFLPDMISQDEPSNSGPIEPPPSLPPQIGSLIRKIQELGGIRPEVAQQVKERRQVDTEMLESEPNPTSADIPMGTSEDVELDLETVEKLKETF